MGKELSQGEVGTSTTSISSPRNFVLHPDWFDVVVGFSKFVSADILSDLGPACTGHHRHRTVRQYQPGREFPLGVVRNRCNGSAPDYIAGAGHRQPDRAMIWFRAR